MMFEVKEKKVIINNGLTQCIKKQGCFKYKMEFSLGDYICKMKHIWSVLVLIVMSFLAPILS